MRVGPPDFDGGVTAESLSWDHEIPLIDTIA